MKYTHPAEGRWRYSLKRTAELEARLSEIDARLTEVTNGYNRQGGVQVRNYTGTEYHDLTLEHQRTTNELDLCRMAVWRRHNLRNYGTAFRPPPLGVETA